MQLLVAKPGFATAVCTFQRHRLTDKAESMAKADAAAEEAEAKAAWLTKSKAVFEGPVGATPHPNPNPPPDP